MVDTTEAEAALIARLLVQPQEFGSVAAGVRLGAADFTITDYGQAWSAMQALSTAGRTLDLIALREAGAKLPDIARILTPAHHATADVYARIIKQAAARRQLAALADGPNSTDDVLTAADDLLDELRRVASAPNGAPVDLADVPEPGPRRYLVGDLLAEGQTTVLYGDGETGKSHLAAALALSVATGTEIIPGHMPAAQGAVVIVDYEDHAETWRGRMSEMLRGIGRSDFPSGNVHYRPTYALPTEATRLASLVRQHQAKLVIVDSAQLASPAARNGADAAESVTQLHAAIRRLNTTALLVAHVPKSNRGELYGSTFGRNIPREVFELQSSSGLRTLRHDKANDRARLPEIGLRVEFAHGRARYHAAVARRSDSPANRQETLVGLLHEAGPMEREEARQALSKKVGREMSDSNLSKIINRANRPRQRVEQDGAILRAIPRQTVPL
ncbi:MAG TPA: AAA family ATPase [Candidatus Limnocylindrales bacterium]|nr:AAA family ATPase [Candidatus Limnocylindrales bacterium]